ncbi:3-hydroxyisobutyryl-CoA hydrolase 1 [Apostasia shenzhenica]|uniref:3-hydroxyisobutyryl-CoA hydrolase n=1 Tax=Apostasia shenzhenica TaxID=1088818 RepID=A0A2I0AEK4_9ASPA|nr:3-hydroxyisobutyryl-CoA hydrolase 1 [Apostasia shenzhenica]
MASPSKDTSNGGAEQVLVERKGYARILVLNRPRQLNALSAQMITDMLKHFTAYEEDPGVKLLIMKGKGKAFCAGGDVAAVVHSIVQGHWKHGANFFWNEFRLNYLIATYGKPQVSLLNGIVMGGGAGVSIHGRFRVATEKTIFAMPETALGLFPDIGASYFLSRLPGFFGEYVGLTGVRLDGAEMLACGLATHFVPSWKLPALEEALLKVESSDTFAVCTVIDKYSERVSLKETSSYNRLDVIDRCFSKKSVEEIISALEQEAVNGCEEWILAAIQSLKKASPISLKISFRSIREGRLQRVGQCLIREYRICCHVLRKEASKDFFEGCRALLVDKDKNPKWEPSRLDLVTGDMVDLYFSAVNDEGWEDLKLPHRRFSSVKLESKL